MAPESPSNRLGNEIRFKEFYLSGEPETTPNYPFESYVHPMVPRYSENGELGVYLEQSVTAPGQMLIVENTDVSCACLSDCSPHTEKPSTHAPTTVLSPPLYRIPLEAHTHLAHKFAKLMVRLEAAKPKDESLLQCIRRLDARRHPHAVVPVNLQGDMNPPGSWTENRGPWNEVEAGVERTLDSERVWNIIANNAICYKVRSKSREKRSEVETCDFWGMWITVSFINHSCIPNCHGMRVGDAIIIRAAKAMAAGEELTLPYFDIFQPLCKRTLAAQRWGFRCNCRRCAFECSLGKPYEAIQGQILNLEQQMQKSWALKDVETHRGVAERLLQKLAQQLSPLSKLLKSLEDREIPFFGQDPLKIGCECLCASFSEPFIAWYGSALQKAYDRQIPPDIEPRGEQAKRWRYLISCITRILRVLAEIHPGNLLCEEFYSILLKARNELIVDDLDEKLITDLASQESYVTMANQFSCYYYGPNVKVFESMNSGLSPRATIFSTSITPN